MSESRDLSGTEPLVSKFAALSAGDRKAILRFMDPQTRTQILSAMKLGKRRAAAPTARTGEAQAFDPAYSSWLRKRLVKIMTHAEREGPRGVKKAVLDFIEAARVPGGQDHGEPITQAAPQPRNAPAGPPDWMAMPAPRGLTSPGKSQSLFG